MAAILAPPAGLCWWRPVHDPAPETDAAAAAVTAVVIRSRLPAWLRWGWAAVITTASLGGWVVDHCSDSGAIGQALRTLWAIRHPSPAAAPPFPPVPPRSKPAP